MTAPVIKEGAQLLVDAKRIKLASDILLDLEANLLSNLEESVKSKNVDANKMKLSAEITSNRIRNFLRQ
jgi:hypothetical protein